MLVLAIAGLIFLMVFIALPALQRSQRDTQRRNDMSRLASAITNYQSNNNGRLPDAGEVRAPSEDSAEGTWPCEASGVKTNSACNIIRTYMNSVNANENEFKDPGGNSYGLIIAPYSAELAMPTTYDRTPIIVTGASCKNDGLGGVEFSNNKRDYAIVFMLEGSGLYCSDSQ